MIRKLLIITVLAVVLLSACTFTYSSSGKKVMEGDLMELELAKESLRLLNERKLDSLILIIDDDIKTVLMIKQLTWIANKCDTVFKSNIYPSDSIITVSQVKVKSSFSNTITKKFCFPFNNADNPEMNRSITVDICNGKVSGIKLSRMRVWKY